MRRNGIFNAVGMPERCALSWLGASERGGRRNRCDVKLG
jgi:hypothetical protein